MNDTVLTEPQHRTELWSSHWSAEEHPLSLDIGDLSLNIAKMSCEWQLDYTWSKKGALGGFTCSPITSPWLTETPKDRIAMEQMTSQIKLTPALADRPIVVRPFSPLTIPADNHITLYVSTPLWIRIELSAHTHKELPVQQLSDTWMGGLTGNGELCYGSHTHARLDKALLEKLPYRALTPVSIHNKGGEDCKLERLSIPTPYLSLFDGDDQLTTEPLSITMDSEKLQGVVNIGKVEDRDLISAPRKSADKGILINTWANLFA